MNPLIVLEKISKLYRSGDMKVPALENLNLAIEAGEFVAIVGASGSGKSTLMHILGCLDRPTAGHYRLFGQDLTLLNDEALARVRNREIGFVFQQFNLLPRATALENVMLPLIYSNVLPQYRRQRAEAALIQVGLADRMHHRPNQLSGGQQQRVAIARALINHPSLILADEPTGALDSKTSQEVMQIFAELNQQGITLVLVTHDLRIAAQTRRVITLEDGCIVSNSAFPYATSAL
jgi:putative ABC transport system ATP-binding protein